MTEAHPPDQALHTIVVGVDGSTGSQRALAWAAARATEAHAQLVAVHVLTYSQELVRDLPPSGFTRWRHSLQEELTDNWAAPARDAGAAVRCLQVEADNAAEGLLNVAETEHASLLVVGAQGHGGLTDRLLGSTGYKLAHRAHQPVVIIPPGWDGAATATGEH